MTAPVPTLGPHPSHLEVELAAVQAIVDPARQRSNRITAAIVALYLAYAGGLDNPIPAERRPAFLEALRRLLATFVAPPDMRRPLRAAMWQALLAGRDAAAQYITGADWQPPPLPPVDRVDLLATLEQRVRQRWEDLERSVRQRWEDLERSLVARRGRNRREPDWMTAAWAAQLAAAAQARHDYGTEQARWADLHLPPGEISWASINRTVVPQVQQPVTRLERDLRWAIGAAFNQASAAVAAQAGVARMWIAERDACLHCLALSGRIAPAGQSFDAGLTFYVGPEGRLKPLAVYPPGPLWGPPRHPNCRCYQIPVPELEGYPVMPWETGPTHPSEALRREARRSVLKGTSGSDSLPARLRATSALLAVGAGLPKSVEAKARAAVRARRFR